MDKSQKLVQIIKETAKEVPMQVRNNNEIFSKIPFNVFAESGLISQEEYEKHKNNVDESYLHTGNTEDESKGGASIFFDPEILAGGSKSGTGLELDTTSIG